MEDIVRLSLNDLEDFLELEKNCLFKGETRESNFKMQKIFEDFGYKIIDKVEKYYDNPAETAYKYSLEI